MSRAGDAVRAARAAQRQRLIDRRLAAGTLGGTLQNAGWAARKPLPSSQAAAPFSAAPGGPCTYIHAFPSYSAETFHGTWTTGISVSGLVPDDMLAAGVQVAVTWVYRLTASGSAVLVSLDSVPPYTLPGHCSWDASVSRTVPAGATDTLILPYVTWANDTNHMIELDVGISVNIASATIQVAQLIISPCGEQLPISCSI